MAEIHEAVRKELIDWAFEITDLSPESQRKKPKIFDAYVQKWVEAQTN